MSNAGSEYTPFYGLNTEEKPLVCVFSSDKILFCSILHSLYNAHAIFAQVPYMFKAVNI